MSDHLLQIKNLSGQSLDGFEITKIDFNIDQGEIHVIVGENNSGQKSFVSVLAGITQATDGEISYKGIQLHEKSLRKSIGDRVAFLFQDKTLVKYLSVEENMMLSHLPKRKGTQLIHWKKVRNKSQNLLEDLGFSIDTRQKVAQLTEEETQLVAIAKVFMNQTELVVLHEPTDNLSAKTVPMLFKILKAFKAKGLSVIYVTKNWEEALKIADYISVISKGKIVGRFTASEAKDNPRKLLTLLDSYSYESLQNSETDIDAHDIENKSVLESVFKAAELLTSEYELKDVLLFLVQSVAKVMNADGARIDLMDYHTKTIIDTYTYDSSKPLQVHLDRNFVLTLLDEDSLYYSNQKEKDFQSHFLTETDIKTMICIPLSIRAMVTGVIHIFYRQIYVHSEDETKYLRAFARQAALSIEDTRLLGRSALLQESHHRIKNNLQAISSFISLQKKYIHSTQHDEMDMILDNIISRIKSITAVHDLLSKDQLGRSIINMKELIRVIINFMKIDKNTRGFSRGMNWQGFSQLHM